MSRTYRNKPPRYDWLETDKNGKRRDGSRSHVSSSCDHHGSCSLCEGNRLYGQKRATEAAKQDLEENG